MGSISGNQRSGVTRVVGSDEQYAADVKRIAGNNRLLTDSVVTVEEIFGQDMLPDSWFLINPSALSSTITLTIGTYTPWVIPINTTDVRQAAKDAVTWLNQQSSFLNYFKARKVLDNNIVHIQSKLWGEWGENATFLTVGSGGTTTLDGYNDFAIRGKPTSLSFDPRDPRVGILGITGQVTAIPGAVGDLVIENALYSSSPEMNIDGSITPQVFTINAINDYDKLIREIRFYANSAGIKFGQFLNKNVPLANGIEVKIKSDNEIITLPLIQTTEDFQAQFALGKVNFQFNVGAGLDNALASFELETPIPLRKIGTFTTDDYIQVKIQDNLSTIARLRFLAFGFKQEHKMNIDTSFYKTVNANTILEHTYNVPTGKTFTMRQCGGDAVFSENVSMTIKWVPDVGDSEIIRSTSGSNKWDIIKEFQGSGNIKIILNNQSNESKTIGGFYLGGFIMRSAQMLTILHNSGLTFTDLSMNCFDFLRDEFTFEPLADDYIYIGYYKPINQIFVEKKSGGVSANIMTGQYYDSVNAVWQNLDGFYDDTKNLTRSGFINWNRNQEDQGNSEINSIDLYWIRLKTGAINEVTLRGINLIFADDNDLKTEFFEILNDNYLPNGMTSHIGHHVATKNDIIQRIRNQGNKKLLKAAQARWAYTFVNTLYGKANDNINAWDILDVGEIREAAKFLCLSKIFFSLSDKPDDYYFEKGRFYYSAFKAAFKLYWLSLDTNDDGKIDNNEKLTSNTVYMTR